jgi:hypothetical protein
MMVSIPASVEEVKNDQTGKSISYVAKTLACGKRMSHVASTARGHFPSRDGDHARESGFFGGGFEVWVADLDSIKRPHKVNVDDCFESREG